MGKYIDFLFDALADKKDFQNLDRIITEEASERLRDFKETLPQADYEKIRDAAFSVSAITKKEAFSIGFKAAMKLVLECLEGK